MSVTFESDKDQDSMIHKDKSTIGELINILGQFPPDMEVHANFKFHVDEDGEIVYLYDARLDALLGIMDKCPQCSQAIVWTQKEKTDEHKY